MADASGSRRACDERVGGDGARFAVEDHAELFDGVRYAIGGGFTRHVAGRRFYPIMGRREADLLAPRCLRSP